MFGEFQKGKSETESDKNCDLHFRLKSCEIMVEKLLTNGEFKCQS